MGSLSGNGFVIDELYLLYWRNFQDESFSSSTRTSAARPREEPHIGKYKLIKTIGKGNFAKVKLAKHIPTGHEVSHFAS